MSEAFFYHGDPEKATFNPADFERLERASYCVADPRRSRIDQGAAVPFIQAHHTFMQAALAEEEFRPRALELLERTSTVRGDPKIAHDAAYAVGIHVLTNWKTLEEIAESREPEAAQAIRLLFRGARATSAIFKIEDAQLDYIGTHLARYVRQNHDHPAGLSPNELGDFTESLLYHDQLNPDRLLREAASLLGEERTLAHGQTVLTAAASFAEVPLDDLRSLEELNFYARLRVFLGQNPAQSEWETRLLNFKEEATKKGWQAPFWDKVTTTLSYWSEQRAIRFPERTIREILTYFGVDGTAMLQGWRNGAGDTITSETSFGAYCGRNIMTIRDLEKRAPGATATLQEEFGIQNFSRLPAEVWHQQYVHKDDPTVPYGAIAFAQQDHKRSYALSREAVGRQLQKFISSVNDLGAKVRIYEFTNKWEALDIILQAKSRYNRRLMFGLVLSHGFDAGITPGIHNGQEQDITVADLQQLQASELGPLLPDYFEDGAGIGLHACHTGTPRGFGDALADLLRVEEVIAPTTSASLETVDVSLRGLGLAVNLRFSKAVARSCRPS